MDCDRSVILVSLYHPHCDVLIAHQMDKVKLQVGMFFAEREEICVFAWRQAFSSVRQSVFVDLISCPRYVSRWPSSLDAMGGTKAEPECHGLNSIGLTYRTGTWISKITIYLPMLHFLYSTIRPELSSKMKNGSTADSLIDSRPKLPLAAHKTNCDRIVRGTLLPRKYLNSLHCWIYYHSHSTLHLLLPLARKLLPF